MEDSDEDNAAQDLLEIQKLRKDDKKRIGEGKMLSGKEESESDKTDSDYEFTGGDLAIYDSALDEVDELLFIRDTLARV
jgi:hypothetical protein